MPTKTLVAGTPQEVHKAIRRALDTAKESAYNIFGSKHSVNVGTCHDDFMATWMSPCACGITEPPPNPCLIFSYAQRLLDALPDQRHIE